MRFRYLILSVLLLAGCGGRSMNKNLAQDLIIGIPGEDLEKKDIDVVKIMQVTGSEAIAETSLKTAFRLERVNGAWVVREVRLGHGQWEKVTNLLQSLERVKREETQQTLNRIDSAIQKYREANGSLPRFKDYIDLSDQLTPKYLTPLIRLDSWRRPFMAQVANDGAITIRSAGPDGKYYTDDDLLCVIQ